MTTPDQLDNWFTYHPPTDETAPKYAAIRAAEAACFAVFDAAWSGSMDNRAYGPVNEACRAFAVAIDENCPDSADKSAAIRCVRLARNAANEELAFLIQSGGSGGNPALETQANDNLRAARWQANAAIACGGR